MPADKHTPGPWRYEESTKTIRAIPSNYWLASMDSWDGAVNHTANARLITHAPAMLAALETISLHAPSLDAQGIRELCDAAITKAKGE